MGEKCYTWVNKAIFDIKKEMEAAGMQISICVISIHHETRRHIN
jgi:hypothetical protein